MKNKNFSTVIINEEYCVGCKICYKVCPVNAIVGTNRMTHTVIQNECIGCNLCISPCPVNCIEKITANYYTK